MTGVPLNLTGQLYGRLTPVRPVGKAPCGSLLWDCVCSCDGKTGFPGAKTVSTRKLREGTVESCGCLKHEGSIKGGKKAGSVLKARAGKQVRRTAMGTRVARYENVTRHYMDAVNDGGRSLTHPGPSKYGKPDLFALQWPAPGTVEVMR